MHRSEVVGGVVGDHRGDFGAEHTARGLGLPIPALDRIGDAQAGAEFAVVSDTPG